MDANSFQKKILKKSKDSGVLQGDVLNNNNNESTSIGGVLSPTSDKSLLSDGVLKRALLDAASASGGASGGASVANTSVANTTVGGAVGGTSTGGDTSSTVSNPNTFGGSSFHQVRSLPIMTSHSHQNHRSHGIPTTATSHATSHTAASHHQLIPQPSTSNPTTTSNTGDSANLLNLNQNSNYLKTGLRLRRQSSYTSTASSISASSSFIPSSSLSHYPASATATTMAGHPAPLQIIQPSTANAADSLEFMQSPSTWASATVSIKKKSVASGTASSPFSSSSSPRRGTGGTNRSSFTSSQPLAFPYHSTSLSPVETTMSPAASFMMAFNNAATFSLGSMDDEEEYAVGDEIGDYTLTREIGSGAFSKVFEAVTPIPPYFMQTNSSTSTTPATTTDSLYTVACKVVRKSGEDEEEGGLKEKEVGYLRQIDRETAIWSRLHHPYILEMNEVIRLDDATIVISELATGGTLLSHIQKTGRPGLELGECKRIGHEIALALAYLHCKMGIIHHDVKLENILLTSDFTVKVADFGFATETGNLGHGPQCPGLCCASETVTRSGKGSPAPGSLHYLAPEHLTTHETLPDGAKGDVWAYGCVLYALLSGRLPFRDTFLPRLQMDILNARWERIEEGEVVEGCLVGDWEKRWDIRMCLKSGWFTR